MTGEELAVLETAQRAIAALAAALEQLAGAVARALEAVGVFVDTYKGHIQHAIRLVTSRHDVSATSAGPPDSSSTGSES